MSTEGAEELRQRADDIVARPEFREDRPSIVERALDWFFTEVGELFGQVAGSGGGYLLGYGILVAALALAAYLVWRLFPRGRLGPPPDGFTIERDTVVSRSRAEWLAVAERAEAAGDWDRAVHARYHALTTGLADEQELSPATSTTSGEHRQRFSSGGTDPARVAVFDRATDTYEAVWFGGADADRPDSGHVEDADRSLLGGEGS